MTDTIAPKRKESESANSYQGTTSSDIVKGGGGAGAASSAAGRSRRNFLKIGAGVAGGVLVAGTIGYFAKDSLLQAAGQTNSSSSGSSASSSSSSSPTTGSSTTTTTTTTSSTVSQIVQDRAFTVLNGPEAILVEAIGETFVPSDSSGPGFKEAGGLYFIDGQLASEYGTNGNMYMIGPFVPPGISTAVTVGSITYSEGSPAVRIGAGTRYQYPLTLRQFWKLGLDALQSYANTKYGGNFETLSSTNQAAVLTDFYNNVPTSWTFSIPSFASGTTVSQPLTITPQDFWLELYYMSWAAFLMDPVYGGNQGLVGWTYTGFNGPNMGNFYGEGYTTQQLMVATTPTRLQPASLAQFEQLYLSSASSTSTSSSSSSSPTTTTSSSSSSLVSSSTTSSTVTSTTTSTSSSPPSTSTTSSTTTTSSSPSSSSSTSSSSSSSSGAVAIPQGAGSGLNFSPANITVAPGTTITWTDDDTVAPHNVHFLTGPTGATLPAVSPTLVKGDTFSVTLTVPGSYTYQCDFHATWMQGTVTVS